MKIHQTKCDYCNREVNFVHPSKDLPVFGYKDTNLSALYYEVTMVGPLTVTQDVMDVDSGNEFDFSHKRQWDFCNGLCMIEYFKKGPKTYGKGPKA
jgi:hypothetical protein